MKANTFEVPEGTYTCKITDINTVLDEKARNKMTWTLKIVDGSYLDSIIEKKFYLTTPKAVGFLKKELKLLGMDVKSSAEFDIRKAELIGVCLILEVKLNEQGYPIFFVKGLALPQDEKVKTEETDINW